MTILNHKYGKTYLEQAHDASSSHRSEIEDTILCGCFYCLATFAPTEIVEWIEEKIGETAICPRCGIDSVLSSEYPIIDSVFLNEMNEYWFA